MSVGIVGGRGYSPKKSHLSRAMYFMQNGGCCEKYKHTIKHNRINTFILYIEQSRGWLNKIPDLWPTWLYSQKWAIKTTKNATFSMNNLYCTVYTVYNTVILEVQKHKANCYCFLKEWESLYFSEAKTLYIITTTYCKHKCKNTQRWNSTLCLHNAHLCAPRVDHVVNIYVPRLSKKSTAWALLTKQTVRLNAVFQTL